MPAMSSCRKMFDSDGGYNLMVEGGWRMGSSSGGILQSGTGKVRCELRDFLARRYCLLEVEEVQCGQ